MQFLLGAAFSPEGKVAGLLLPRTPCLIKEYSFSTLWFKHIKTQNAVFVNSALCKGSVTLAFHSTTFGAESFLVVWIHPDPTDAFLSVEKSVHGFWLIDTCREFYVTVKLMWSQMAFDRILYVLFCRENLKTPPLLIWCFCLKDRWSNFRIVSLMISYPFSIWDFWPIRNSLWCRLL